MAGILSSLPMIIAAILCFGLIVFAHELGHFLVAIWRGIPVEEFSMGMGPLLFTTMHGDIRYSLRLLPIGAFVRLVGEESEDEAERASYFSAPVGSRIAMTFAGPFFNFVVAVLIFTGIGFFSGIASEQPVIGEVRQGGIAEASGLEVGDRFLSIDGKEIVTWTDAVRAINAAPDKEIVLTIERGSQDEPIYLTTTPEKTASDGLGRIGIVASVEKHNILTSVQLGFSNTLTAIKLFYSSIADMMTGKQAVELVGPIGIIQTTGEMAQNGIADLLWFMAFISINLGVVNLLPIPPLDGARILLMFIEALRGKPLPPEREGMIHMVGYVFLIGLIVVISFKDIVNLFQG